jgi:hypothetical protein
MDFSILEKIYSEFDREFLTDMAIEWGFINDTRLIFIERMASDRGHLSNAGLHRQLGFSVENKVGDTLSRQIYPKLIELGCPSGTWEVVVQWLKDKVFPEWSKLKLRLWEKMWQQAELSQNITIEPDSIPGQLADALPRQLVEIPKISIGTIVEYSVRAEPNRFFILLEKDLEHSIGCMAIAPSRISPRYEIIEPVAREQLLAIVSSREPQLSWLAAARQDFVEVDASMLAELRLWIEGNQDCQLLKREFEIVN